jgi:hypothetical protein
MFKKVKWTGGVAQVLECLLCKLEARSSNPSATQNKQINKKILKVNQELLATFIALSP